MCCWRAVWLWFTINGFMAARQRRFADHRRHMVRSATVALSTIANRIWTPMLFITLQPLQDSVFGGNEEHYPVVRGGPGCVAGVDDSAGHRAMVADPQTGNAAVVNFSV